MEPWEEAFRAFAASGRPILGTCAGAIVLAREVENPPQKGLGLLDISVERNAYGRQVDSFIGEVDCPALGAPLPAVFIRAPRIRRVGPGVEILGRRGGEPVLVAAGQHRRGDVPPRADCGPAAPSRGLRLRGIRAEERVSLVSVETRDEVVVLTLDRPKANAFSPELVDGAFRRVLPRQREGAGDRADLGAAGDVLGRVGPAPPGRPEPQGDGRVRRRVLRARAADLRLRRPGRGGAARPRDRRRADRGHGGRRADRGRRARASSASRRSSSACRFRSA